MGWGAGGWGQQNSLHSSEARNTQPAPWQLPVLLSHAAPSSHAPSPPNLPPRSVRDASGASLKVFQAHTTGILSIAQAGTRTYTLAADGCIKGWSSAVPHPADLQAL